MLYLYFPNRKFYDILSDWEDKHFLPKLAYIWNEQSIVRLG